MFQTTEHAASGARTQPRTFDLSTARRHLTYLSAMIRLIPVLIGLLLVIAAFKWLTTRAGAVADRFTPQSRVEGGRPGRYEFDKRREQVYRDIKKVPRAPERRDELVTWLDAHSGVEAYVEPNTGHEPEVGRAGRRRRGVAPARAERGSVLARVGARTLAPDIRRGANGIPAQDASSSRRVLNEVPDGGILPGREAVGRCALEG